MTRISNSFRSLGLLVAAVAVATPALAQPNFTRYVSVGDSLTAGFQSGGLLGTLTRNSYPALINRQAVGSDSGFLQPIVSAPGIPSVNQLVSLVGPVIAPPAGAGTLTNPLLVRPYNNVAVPGANVRDVLMTSTGGLHDLVLQQFSPALRGRTQLQQAVSLAPTFVTIWIGNNDALAAATTGRVIDNVTLTTVDRFNADYRAVVGALAATGAQLAIANIPDVTTIPFVNTVPRVVVNPATSQPVIINGNTVPLIGPNGPLGAGDRVLLTATTELRMGKGIPVALGGSGQPLSDGVVLSAAEIATISARVAAFNGIIQTVANERNAAFVDANAILRRAAVSGIPIGGITFTPAFLTGGIFSYDGVHPTTIGYSVLANAFLEAINARFGGNIEPVDLSTYIFGGQSASLDLEATFDTELLFTEEARRNLFWSLGIPENLPPTPTGRRPRGRRPR